MPFDFSLYRVASGESPISSSKFNNFLQAVQDALNDFPLANLHGYPGDATKFLNGAGAWATPLVDIAYKAQLTSTVTATGTAKTDLFGAALQIPGGLLNSTSLIRLYAGGTLVCNDTNAPNGPRMELRLGSDATGVAGGQVIWDSGVMASAIFNKNAIVFAWFFQAYIQMTGSLVQQRTIGSFISGGNDHNAVTGAGGLDIGSVAPGFYGAVTTVNMSGTQRLSLNATMPSTTGVTMTRDLARLEAVV